MKKIIPVVLLSGLLFSTAAFSMPALLRTFALKAKKFALGFHTTTKIPVWAKIPGSYEDPKYSGRVCLLTQGELMPETDEVMLEVKGSKVITSRPFDPEKGYAYIETDEVECRIVPNIFNKCGIVTATFKK